MSTTEASDVIASAPNDEGYREYTLGNFKFRRDEFFAHISWPTGEHTISIDAFLR